VSADAGNASVIGTDGLIFTPAGGGGGLVTASSVAGFPAAGEPGKVYLAEDSGDTFRFDATARGTDTYVRISETTVSTKIEDSTEIGRALITAATQAAARIAVGPQVFDARDYGVIADGQPRNNVANLLDCFAACAAAGGGTVLLPDGVINTSDANIGPVIAESGATYTNDGGIPLPASTPITVRGHGTAVTVIKLSPGFMRAFDFTGVDKSYTSVHLRDFTVDRDNISGATIASAAAVTGAVTLAGAAWTTLPGISAATFKNAQTVYFLPSGGGTAAGKAYPARVSGGNGVEVWVGGSSVTVNSGDTVQGSVRGHVIVGTNCGRVRAGVNMNFDGITVTDVSAINVAESAGPSLSGTAPDRSLGIDIYLTMSGSIPTLKATNIVARNVRIEGGAYGIQVTGNDNTFLDDIWFVDCYHDTKVAPVRNWNSSNFIIGGGAWVNRCGVVRCNGRRSGDVSFEVDQPWDCYEIDCVWEDAWSGIYRSTFTPPARTASGPNATTLVGALTAAASTCAVAALPVDVERQGLAKIDNELVWYECTDATGTAWSLWRGINGTSAAAHSDAAKVTFVETARTRIHSIRPTIKNKDVLAAGGGTSWSAYDNSNLPIPPITIRDATVTNIGGNFATVRPGHVFNTQGWCPEIDMEGVRVYHSGLNITAASGVASAFSVYSAHTKTMFTNGVPCPAPRISGRNNFVRMHGKFTNPLLFATLHSRGGWFRYDLNLDSDFAVVGADSGIGAYLDLGAAAAGSRLGLKMRGGGATTNAYSIIVGTANNFSIEDTLGLDADLSEVNFAVTANDSKYTPWGISSGNTGKIVFGKIIHSKKVSSSYPSSKRGVVRVIADYTVKGYEEILLVDSTANPVTITLPRVKGGSSNTGDPLTTGRVISVVDVGYSSSINAITITPASTDRINRGVAGAPTSIRSSGTQIQLTAYELLPGWLTDTVGQTIKVVKPNSPNSAGLPGYWAADETGAYFYTGDGTTHSWAAAVTGSSAVSNKPLSLWSGTKAQYDAIATKSATTIYVVTAVTAVTGDITVDEGAQTGDIAAEPVAEEPATRSATTKSTRKK
jgi:hypothetical protein